VYAAHRSGQHTENIRKQHFDIFFEKILVILMIGAGIKLVNFSLQSE
jgi:hypothetical protein